jgi:hypothetical protein
VVKIVMVVMVIVVVVIVVVRVVRIEKHPYENVKRSWSNEGHSGSGTSSMLQYCSTEVKADSRQQSADSRQCDQLYAAVLLHRGDGMQTR